MTDANESLRTLGEADLNLESAPRPRHSTGSAAPQRLVAAYADALLAQAQRNPDVVALDADLMLDCGLVPFRDKFPRRFIECGIAEQDMVSQAGGLALKGLLPVVHSFACFLSSRPNEQIYNNATEHTKIVYMGALAGVLPGGTGHSHQCVRDISALSAVPGLSLLEPSCEQEVAMLLDYGLNHTPDSIYLRLVSLPCEIPFRLPDDYRVQPGRGVTLLEGSDAVIFAYGPVMLSEASRAAGLLLSEHGIRLRVVNLPWLNHIDVQWLSETVAGVSHVFTLDNHYITGGQGQMIAAALAGYDPGHDLRIRHFGVRDIPFCGRNDEVLRAHRLDAVSLSADIFNSMAVQHMDTAMAHT